MTASTIPEPSRSPPRARRLAAILALAYLLLCYAYIIVSSALAARVAASSVERMAAVEMAKGLAFVVVTGIAFFFFAYRLLRRVEERQDALTRSREALMQAERRALAGVFAASIAHDMNNTLTLVGAEVTELTDPATVGPRRDLAADQLDKALRDLAALARRLMSIGKASDTVEFTDANLLSLVLRIVDLARSHVAVRHCRITVAGDSSLVIRLDQRMIGQLMLNLLLNAAEATGGRGKIEVFVKRQADDGACLEVHDNGPGISDEVKARLFEPFATTKAHGTGLGLVSVRAVAQQHGGSVEVDRSALGGALFRIILRGGPR